MNVLNVTFVDRGVGFEIYNVIAKNWKNTKQNRETLYNSCDKNNWGGDIKRVEPLNGIHIIQVKIYTD